MATSDDLYDDLHEFLHTEELKASYQRAQIEYLDQLYKMRQEKIYGSGDPGAPVDAIQRVIDKERERGLGEDVLEDLEWALRRMRENMAEEIKEKRRQKKLAREAKGSEAGHG